MFIEAMVAFWRDTIGLKPSYISDEWSEFSLNNIILALHQDRENRSRHTGIVFQLDEIYGTVSKLKNLGVKVSVIKDIGVGFEATLSDPDGNEYNIFQLKG